VPACTAPADLRSLPFLPAYLELTTPPLPNATGGPLLTAIRLVLHHITPGSYPKYYCHSALLAFPCLLYCIATWTLHTQTMHITPFWVIVGIAPGVYIGASYYDLTMMYRCQCQAGTSCTLGGHIATTYLLGCHLHGTRCICCACASLLHSSCTYLGSVCLLHWGLTARFVCGLDAPAACLCTLAGYYILLPLSSAHLKTSANACACSCCHYLLLPAPAMLHSTLGINSHCLGCLPPLQCLGLLWSHLQNTLCSIIRLPAPVSLPVCLQTSLLRWYLPAFSLLQSPGGGLPSLPCSAVLPAHSPDPTCTCLSVRGLPAACLLYTCTGTVHFSRHACLPPGTSLHVTACCGTACSCLPPAWDRLPARSRVPALCTPATALTGMHFCVSWLYTLYHLRLLLPRLPDLLPACHACTACVHLPGASCLLHWDHHAYLPLFCTFYHCKPCLPPLPATTSFWDHYSMGYCRHYCLQYYT